MSNIGSVIRLHRVKKGLSQRELGVRLGGISTAFVCKIENGNSPLPKEYIENVCRALGVKEETIISAMKADFMSKFNE